MALIQGKFIADGAVDGSKVKLNNNEALKARNAADNADVEILKVNASDQIELASDAFVGANKVQTAADKGVANGLATLDGSGLVPASQLPSYVDDVLEFADLASFPVTGETGKIYVALDANLTYRWSGSAYVQIASGAVQSVNGADGVVVLDTDDISEGLNNFYYTSARFDTSFAAKKTDDLSEGLSNFYYTETRFNSSFAGKSSTDLSEGTNLYFTDARAKTAAVVNSTAGTETDQAPSVSAVKTYVAAEISAAEKTFDTEIFTLAAGDITNGYVDLAQTPIEVLNVTPKGGLKQEEGVDYTISTNRLTFAGDLATLLASGDKLMVTYVY